MDRRRIRFLTLSGAVVVAMAALIFVGVTQTQGMHYYLTVGEFLDTGSVETDRFRVNGKVVEGTIERLPSGQDVRFVMTDGERTLAVSYHGIIPDTFVDRADVVVEGKMGSAQVFEAHNLLAKCPSKYEAADGATEAYGTQGEPSGSEI